MESGWSVTDREDIAITMAMRNAPHAVTMELQKEYAERYDWLVKEFTDWAFTFMTSFLYYMDYDTIDEQTRDLYRQGISAFGGISPTYRIALEKDSPVIVWDFHSLLVMGADVLFLHAHGQRQQYAYVQTLQKSICRKPEGK